MTEADRSSRTLLAALAGYATVVLVTTAGTTAAAGFGCRWMASDDDRSGHQHRRHLRAAIWRLPRARLAPTGRAVMTLGLLMLALLAMAVAASRFWPDTRSRLHIFRW
jgi:hypothetical protein